jgi:hypothetical protein
VTAGNAVAARVGHTRRAAAGIPARIISPSPSRAGFPAVAADSSREDLERQAFADGFMYSHPLVKSTGKPTGKISYKFLSKAKRLMRSSFAELSAQGLG